MIIRKLNPDDWSAYRALRLEALEREPEAFAADLAEQAGRPPDDWQSRLAPNPDAFVLGAFDDVQNGRLVGMAGLRRESLAKVRHKATVWGVYVTPAARGRGLARLLMERLMAEARQMAGLEQLTLTVVRENEPARRLYLGLGFTVYGTEPRALRVGDRYLDEDLMVRFLAAHHP